MISAVLRTLPLIAYLISFSLANFASCGADWDWAKNMDGQNPCQVAGSLEAACQSSGEYVLVDPLRPGTNYPPQKHSTCKCNTVMYSLYMACTACQNMTIESWSFWHQHCDQVYVAQYPDHIPSGTTIPGWAYFNVTISDVFDPVAAKAARVGTSSCARM